MNVTGTVDLKECSMRASHARIPISIIFPALQALATLLFIPALYRAIHGIAGNDFIIQATGKTMYCTEDSTVETVGSATASAGKMSPRNLLTTTMTDELRLATNFRSKVIAIASKDRGSILPGGHTANAAY